jgi:hypothetical protein
VLRLRCMPRGVQRAASGRRWMCSAMHR